QSQQRELAAGLFAAYAVGAGGRHRLSFKAVLGAVTINGIMNAAVGPHSDDPSANPRPSKPPPQGAARQHGTQNETGGTGDQQAGLVQVSEGLGNQLQHLAGTLNKSVPSAMRYRRI